ncbi:MAG TPA: SAM-dependent methyltransferase [Gammaproteobacteria bacterium]|nr:SAM-dependent methyltransferase [Gammaproteobacteria bacterium]
MNKIHSNAIASIEFKLSWQSQFAYHVDCYFGEKVNFWRDFFPQALQEALLDKTVGDEVEVPLPDDDMILPHSSHNIFTLQRTQFNSRFLHGKILDPRLGRFYPKKFLQNVSGAVKEKLTPFRCIRLDETTLQVDFNHPLAQQTLKLAAKVHEVQGSREERGGRCNDWVEIMTRNGIGFQSRYENMPTDFFYDDPFARMDWTDDSEFYSTPRLVSHLDAKAIEVITGFYSQFIKPGMKVLDLMSSWKSHLPEKLELADLMGLGLNQEELENNNQLTGYLLHDLNKTPRIPFDDKAFDAVICTVSVEYLTQPFEVFQEVSRILKAGGYFIVTFSNRWFPPKVINIWPDLHEFERIGLVMEYFLKSEQYNHLSTYSMRNFPRPADDKYIHESQYADPVFAVCGQKV